ncbi:hypothetical protein O0L34_g17801 [Tuta absoluta]|nr:hypothetical protein O0L34_g17801 [Tuta absoluta]
MILTDLHSKTADGLTNSVATHSKQDSASLSHSAGNQSPISPSLQRIREPEVRHVEARTAVSALVRSFEAAACEHSAVAVTQVQEAGSADLSSSQRAEASTAVSISKDSASARQSVAHTVGRDLDCDTGRSSSASSKRVLEGVKSVKRSEIIVGTEPLVGDAVDGGDWMTVHHKKKRFYSSCGKANSESNSKFRAAENSVPLYISNVDKEVQEEDIIDYIRRKTSVKVKLDKIKPRVERNFNAFKLYVPRVKVHLFLQDELWPEGITFRRFVLFKANRSSSVN